MQRRAVLALMAGLALAGLSGCGFHLRGAQNYAFGTLAVMPQPGGPLALELRRSFGTAVHVLQSDEPLTKAHVVLDILRVKFRVRTPPGKDLAPESEILLTRDISFNESAVLAKEAEEALLYRDMQTDAVQQLLRRLAMIRID